MKRVFIVHGWDGYPEEGWFPWLKTELQKQGFSVFVPQLSHPERPTIEDWVRGLSQAVGSSDQETYFVGHSIGCQTILRYLMSLETGSKVGGVVCVAGFFDSLTLGTGEEKAIAAPWLKTPIDFEKIKKVCGKFFGIFSNIDKWVPLENEKKFKENLGMTMVIDGKGKSGHFSGSDGVRELPGALSAVLKMANT